MSKWFVYGLTDPRDYVLCYIGISCDVWRRLKDHYKWSKTEDMIQWIDWLKSEGLCPSLRILSEHPDEESARLAEKEMIQKHRSTPSLRNIMFAKEPVEVKRKRPSALVKWHQQQKAKEKTHLVASQAIAQFSTKAMTHRNH